MSWGCQVDEDTWLLNLIIPQSRPLSLNDSPSMSRGARMGRANLIKQIREDTTWLCKAGRVPTCQRVRVTLICEPADLNAKGHRSRPRRDPINLTPTLKVVQDGIVDAGVVPDDTPKYMESPMPVYDVPKRGSTQASWYALIERLA